MTKGRLGRLSDHTGHNASKRRAGLETHNAEADPPLKRGRRHERKGTPQGSPISPLFSNIYMRRFILGWKVLGYARHFKAEIVNYADDCAPRRCVEEAVM